MLMIKTRSVFFVRFSQKLSQSVRSTSCVSIEVIGTIYSLDLIEEENFFQTCPNKNYKKNFMLLYLGRLGRLPYIEV